MTQRCIFSKFVYEMRQNYLHAIYHYIFSNLFLKRLYMYATYRYGKMENKKAINIYCPKSRHSIGLSGLYSTHFDAY